MSEVADTNAAVGAAGGTMAGVTSPSTFDPSGPGIFRRLVSIVALRCPRCCRGRAWRAPFRMNRACPVCTLGFEREPGYFTGAMYASYAIGIFGTMPAWMIPLFAGASLTKVLVIGIGLVVLLGPVSFHVSRMAWMHVDCYFNPKTFESDAGALPARSS